MNSTKQTTSFGQHGGENLKRILIIFASVIGIGTIGYSLIEGWNLLEALYMTVITLSTVGFREVGPLSPAGQVWTIVVIIVGVSTIAYTGVSQAAEFILEFRFWKNRKMIRRINAMKNHYIICGFGRMGRVIAGEFRERNREVVIIENEPEIVNDLSQQGYPYIDGSAIDDSNLEEAGIDRASGLVAVLSTDADNLFVALSARKLNPDLFILTRCTEERTQEKMLAAGANKVVNPYEIGGHKMALMMLSPHVDDFIEIVSRHSKINLAIEQIQIAEGSSIAGKQLIETPIRSRYDTIVTAILDKSNEMQFNPASNTIINADDILICIGDRDNLHKLEMVAKGESAKQ